MRKTTLPAKLFLRPPIGATPHTLESDARYRGLLEAAPDAMVVVNALGEIVLLNSQAEKTFGYPRDELIGQQVTNIIPEGSPSGRSSTGFGARPKPRSAQQIGPASNFAPGARTGGYFPNRDHAEPHWRALEGVW